ncbi:hypothetical protein DY000_02031396 [Brassica cretica]|uniref:Uncharacterized protein n=1 Tax=Brassica cretica TaxID=69181 RepID=A0ABQ7DHM8_BRACR|nr:hypothetical protein DY000_02031396 [Brassica cretica]
MAKNPGKGNLEQGNSGKQGAKGCSKLSCHRLTCEQTRNLRFLPTSGIDTLRDVKTGKESSSLAFTTTQSESRNSIFASIAKNVVLLLLKAIIILQSPHLNRKNSQRCFLNLNSAVYLA